MKKNIFLKLNELPLSNNFIMEQKKEIFNKLTERKQYSLKYLIPALGISIFIAVLFFKKYEQPKIKLPDESISFYQMMDMLEYMDVLENLTEEELNENSI